MSSLLKKEDAKALIDNLPESATWEDLMYEIYVREAVEAGLADSKAGRITEVGQLRKEFGHLLYGNAIVMRPDTAV